MYSAYFKQTNYRKLLLSVFVALCAFSVIDYVVVQFISNREVFGLDGRIFAVFGEGTWDVTHQIKNMPLLVLAAQICPASIEGTLFAFIMSMFNMGSSYGSEFASWLTEALEVSSQDFLPLPVAQALRVALNLTPILMLWLIPDKNPVDVVAEIDASLGGKGEEGKDADSGTMAEEVAASAEDNQPWDFSGWPMLLLLMPPIGLFQIAQPLKNSLGWSQPVLVIPTLMLIAIPGYQHFVVEKGKGAASAKPADALAEGLTDGAETEPDAPPPAEPELTAL